eukprot:COSAG01_NODE_4291_length_5167_cov_3.885556_2_plen_188_part_00
MITGGWRTVECWTLAWSPDGALLASGSQSGAVNLWSVESGTKATTLDPHGKFSMSVAYSPDGKLLAVGDAGGAVTVFDVVSTTPVCKLEGHSMPVRALAFGPDSASLLTGSDDKQIHHHDIKSGSLIASLGGHSSWVLGVVSRAFPSWNRSILTEIYLCHACSYHEIGDGNARTGALPHAGHVCILR